MNQRSLLRSLLPRLGSSSSARVKRQFRWRFGEHRWRLARAWRYARHRLTEDDAQTMMLECRHTAGWYPLNVLTVEDTLEQALETFELHPELSQLIADACARVARKWEDYGDTLHGARCWAIDLAREYAAQDRIDLVPRSDPAANQADTANG